MLSMKVGYSIVYSFYFWTFYRSVLFTVFVS